MGIEHSPTGEPLLHTKLYAPTRHGIWVPRARLLKRLDESVALGHKLILISAPPGFGKTTLVTEWLTQENPAHRAGAAWYALDESDNDTARFMSYFYAALERQGDNRAEWQELRTLLNVSPLPALDALLTAAINLVQSESATAPRVLVLEDYHVIQNADLHRALAFWLDHSPPGFHLVITSRADPPLPLSRLRARMQLTEIRAADLRFTAQEAATFLQSAMGLQLTPAQVATLEQKTEGWIAGLQLAALSLQKNSDADAMLRAFTGTHRYIMDYLVEEVLQREPEHIQNFLLRTSLLDRFSASLCETLAPAEQDAGAQLDYLERRNLFIVPLDDRREWYRFHHLFAEVLRQRLRRLDPSQIPHVYERAAAWCETQQLYQEAIQYNLAAPNYERAAALIQQNAEAMLYQGTRATLQRWLDALPPAILDARPELWLSRAEVYVISQALDAAEEALTHVDKQLPRIEDDARRKMLSGKSAAIRAKIALNRSDIARTLEMGQLALDTLDENELLIRSSVWLHMGVAYDWNGQLERALTSFSQARRLGEQAQDASATVLAIANYGAAEKTRAEYRRAADIYRQGLQVEAPYHASYLPAAVYLYTDLAELHYEWNDLEGSRPFTDQAVERSELLGLTRARVVSYRILARWFEANGKFVQAQDMLTQALQLVQEHQIPSHYASPARAVQVHLWLNTGNLTRAVEWATQSGLETGETIDKPRQEEYLAFAQVCLAQNEPTRARAILERLLADAENGGRTECVIWALAHLALVHHAQDDAERALAALTRALELAEPQGFVRTFLDLGAPMQAVLKANASSVPVALRGYVETLGSGNATPAAPKPPTVPAPYAPPEIVEELTEREKQVLQLVAQGLSDKQIAAQLIVATGTVKRHLNNIYGKLGVNSRTQALARARQVGWIA